LAGGAYISNYQFAQSGKFARRAKPIYYSPTPPILGCIREPASLLNS
jgi:hypothetical protein